MRKNVIFIAPPAAGKGTQSELLVNKYGYCHISTGDLLREEVASGSELGKELDVVMKSGALVSNEIVTDLLRKRLTSKDIENGFILDGYPRTLDQAKMLIDLAKELNIDLGYVIYLDMDKTTAMHRALGRQSCPQCGRGYNKYEDVLKPKVENICDDCGIELISRSDDNEETFNERFDTFIENTKPLLDYFEEQGILKTVDNTGTPEEIFERIESVI